MKHYILSLVLLLFLISSCSTLTESVDNNTLSESYEPIKSNSNRFERDRTTTRIRQPQFHQPQVVTVSKQKQVQRSQDKKELILERKPFSEEIFPIIYDKQVPSQKIKQPQIYIPSPKKLLVKKPIKRQKKLVKFKRKKIKRQKKLLMFKLEKQKPVKSYKRLVKRHKKPVKHITRGQYEQGYSSVTEPAPPLNLTDILSNYRLGKGDLIDIKVFSEKDLSMKVRLSEEGIISYPFLGELDLAGLTVNEVEKLISSGLDGDYLIDPKVTVAILEYRQLFVNGETKKPGGYDFVPGMTVNKAISLAGGFTERASRDEIFIIRDGDDTATPLPAMLDSYIGPGDIINIKQYKKFFVDGEVKNPGGYEYLNGITVKKAISMAGGFTDKADHEAILLVYQKQQYTQYLVDLNMNVEPGDIITIKAYQKFFVGGEVKKPGGYDYLPGQTVDAAISMAGGFTDKADRGAIFIGHQGYEQTLSLVNLYTQVKPGDIITIQEYQKFFVDGEVKNPGGYNYMLDMTVKTAISMAGGFTLNANREAIILDYQGNDQIDPIVDLHEAVKPGDIITIKSYQKIFVDGEVKNPAAYDYLRDLTVKTAISMAGGFTEKADRNTIFIAHQGYENTQYITDIYAPVKPGDVITIKEYQKIFVDGEVKNPGSYAYLQNLTVKTAISMAGGFTEKSSREEIYIIHQGDEQTKIAVNLYTQVKPGDIITIQEYQKFFVDGEVEKPGDYTYLAGLTIKTALSMAGGFTEKAARGQIFIAHHGDEQTQTPANIYSAVKPGDIITVQKYQKIFVNGEVKNSGGYDFIPGLTVEKAISMAGGFTQYGSARWSKFYILPENDKTGKAKRVKVSTPVYPGDVITIKESLF